MQGELISSRWVYIFGMENEGDMFGAILGDHFGGGMDLYKIGTTINPKRRWHQVQVHSPWDLRVFAIIPGGFELEAYLHKCLEEYRTRGEWFSMPRGTMDQVLDELDGFLTMGRTLFDDLPWCSVVDATEELEHV